MQSVNLLDFDLEGMAAFCDSLGERRFRATQLFRWIHQKGACDFAQMSDLAKSLRDKLAVAATIAPLQVVSEHTSADGTVKWLFDVGAGNAIETVFIPEDDRGTLCISSQAGCAVGCRFCSTRRRKAASAPASASFRAAWPAFPSPGSFLSLTWAGTR